MDLKNLACSVEGTRLESRNRAIYFLGQSTGAQVVQARVS